jgi:hypothetical protein
LKIYIKELAFHISKHTGKLVPSSQAITRIQMNAMSSSITSRSYYAGNVIDRKEMQVLNDLEILQTGYKANFRSWVYENNICVVASLEIILCRTYYQSKKIRKDKLFQSFFFPANISATQFPA